MDSPNKFLALQTNLAVESRTSAAGSLSKSYMIVWNELFL